MKKLIVRNKQYSTAYVGAFCALVVSFIVAVISLLVGIVNTTVKVDEPQAKLPAPLITHASAINNSAQAGQMLSYSSAARNANVSGSVTNQGCTVSATYYEDENRVVVSWNFSGYSGDLGELDYYSYVTFGSQRHSIGNNTFLGSNSFFQAGNTYTVHAHAEDMEYQSTGSGFCVDFLNVLTFTIPREAVALPEPPVKEGYTFVGWFYDEAFTQPYDGAPIYADTALYAKMQINKYTVSYDTDGGTPVDSVTVDWNAPAPMPATERVGFNFVGWFYADGTKYNGEAIKADTTLTAHWQVKMFTVTFYVDGEVYTAIDVPYGSPLSDVTSQQGLTYYNLYDENGVALGGNTVIEGVLTINAQRMTPAEKRATFFAKHAWVLWTWGGVTIFCFFGFVVCIVYIKKRV